MSNARLLRVTHAEKATIISTGLLEGTGGAGIISTFFWYATVPLAPVVSMMTVLGIGIASILIALPIAYVTFKKFRTEIDTVRAALAHELAHQKKNQEKLFFEILRVRSLFASDVDFRAYFNNTTCHDVNHQALMALVCHVYHLCKTKNCFNDWQQINMTRQSREDNGSEMSFAQLIQNSYLAKNDVFRHEALDYCKYQTPDFDQHLSRCFISTCSVTKVSRSRHVMHGLVAGLSMTGIALSTGWTLASLMISAGIIASVPLVGWAIFGLASIALGVCLGVGIASTKHKNSQRAAWMQQLKHHNHALVDARESIHTLYAHRYVSLVADKLRGSDKKKRFSTVQQSSQSLSAKRQWRFVKQHQVASKHGAPMICLKKNNLGTPNASGFFHQPQAKTEEKSVMTTDKKLAM